jgi:hypothetical protein
MDSIKQTRFLAQNYPQLQGLRVVPLSLYLVCVTLWANSLHGPGHDITLPLLLAPVCLAFILLVEWFYNHKYGRVKRRVTHAEMFSGTMAILLALAAFILDNLNITRVSFLGLVFAGAFAFTGYWYWRPAKVMLITNLVLGGSFTILSILPVVVNLNWWTFLGIKNSLLGFTFLFGVLGTIGGLISHIYFVRSLPVPMEAS